MECAKKKTLNLHHRVEEIFCDDNEVVTNWKADFLLNVQTFMKMVLKIFSKDMRSLW